MRVRVRGNQSVKKEDLLFEIDPRPFEYRVALMEARLAQAVHQVAQMESELTASKAGSAQIVAEEAYAWAVQEQKTEIRKQWAARERE